MQFGAGSAGAIQGLIGVDCGGIEEADRVGQFDALVGSRFSRRARPKSEVSQLRARHDQALLFVLQLHVGAQGIDAGADAVLLQVGGLIVNGLRQIDARLGGLHIGGGALAAEVLRHHQHARSLREPWFPGRANRRCRTGWRDSGATSVRSKTGALKLAPNCSYR